MPCELTELERGAVCLALYPFTTGFPMERIVRDAEGELLAQLERYETVEEIQAEIAPDGDPPEIIVRFKLRRVVVLHDGTHRSIEDVAVARVNSITEEKRTRRERWYRRLSEGVHPTQLLIGQKERHGMSGREAYVDATSISSIRKATVLRRTGQLDEDEMRQVSARMIAALEIDVSDYVQQLGSEAD